MKKTFLVSILSLSIACPAFADIGANESEPTCDNSTIGTYSGSTEMEAQWNRNTINLKWYDEDGEITNVGNTSKTCLYDGAITLPTEPTRPGYTFDKWVVRPTGFDLTILLQYVNTSGSAYGYIELNGTESTNATTYGRTTKTPASYGLTERGEWTTEFEYGNVKGIAGCSSDGSGETKGNHGEPTFAANRSYGNYCWCKVTGYDAEKDGTYLDVLSSYWVFVYDFTGKFTSCSNGCASNCANDTRANYNFRSGLYTIAQ